MDWDTYLLTVASHELGHALAAEALGYTVDVLQVIGGDEGIEAWVQWGGDAEIGDDDPTEVVNAHMIVAWAGWAAEVRALTELTDMGPGEAEAWAWDSAQRDRDEIWEVHRHRSSLGLDEVREVARRLVDQEWARNAALAPVLVQRGHMTGADL
jgi:hypothetical protein